MSPLGGLLVGYGMFGLLAAFMCVLLTIDEEIRIIDDLGKEGRAVLAILIGALWPLLVVAGVLWLLRAGGRGIAQVWRVAFPKKPLAEVPEARTVRR